VEIVDILTYRQHLKYECTCEFGLPTDICILTEQEIENNFFLEEEGAVLVYY